MLLSIFERVARERKGIGAHPAVLIAGSQTTTDSKDSDLGVVHAARLSLDEQVARCIWVG
jgi:hypothetical protein